MQPGAFPRANQAELPRVGEDRRALPRVEKGAKAFMFNLDGKSVFGLQGSRARLVVYQDGEPGHARFPFRYPQQDLLLGRPRRRPRQ